MRNVLLIDCSRKFDFLAKFQPKYYTNSLAVDEDGELYMVGQQGIGLKGSGSVFRLKFSQEVEFTAAVN